MTAEGASVLLEAGHPPPHVPDGRRQIGTRDSLPQHGLGGPEEAAKGFQPL